MAKIDDYGAFVPGAAKHRWADYLKRMTAIVGPDIANASMTQIWPDMAYSREIENGADSKTVSYVRALRDSIPAKPTGATALIKWVQVVTETRTMAQNLLEDRIPVQKLEDTLSESAKTWPMVVRAKAYEKAGHDNSMKGMTVTAKSYARGSYYMIHMKAPGARSPWGVASTIDEATGLVVDKLREHLAKKRVAKAKCKISVYSRIVGPNRDTQRLACREISGGKPVTLHVFPAGTTAKEAHAYIAANEDALNEKFEMIRALPPMRENNNARRVGPDYRHGRDVSPEVFEAVFGVPALQFGESMSNAQRQIELNETFDSLLDMSAALDCPPSCLSLGGRLAFAFGARGKGGVDAAKAHYEPLYTIINLTKRKGPGSTAHEWFHGFDNVTARDGAANQYAMSSTLTGAFRGQHVAPEQAPVIKGIRETYTSFAADTDLVKRSAACDDYRSSPYFSLPYEVMARGFEGWMKHTLAEKGITNDYLVNMASPASFQIEKDALNLPVLRYPYPLAEEMPVIASKFESQFLQDGPVRAKLLSFEKPECRPYQEFFPAGLDFARAPDVVQRTSPPPEIQAREDDYEPEQLSLF